MNEYQKQMLELQDRQSLAIKGFGKDMNKGFDNLDKQFSKIEERMYGIDKKINEFGVPDGIIPKLEVLVECLGNFVENIKESDKFKVYLKAKSKQQQ